MSDLGQRLRTAREAAGISLSGMASRTGYSDGYLGNVETGVRDVTPKIIRAYERVLGVDRRSLLIGIASMATSAMSVAGVAIGDNVYPSADVAVDVFRDIAAERSTMLASVQTSHATDKAIGALVARDAAGVASLAKWARKGSPVLRVNSVGILAKVGSPVLDNGVVLALKGDQQARHLYLTAVCSRVLNLPWDEATHLANHLGPLAESAQVQAFVDEVANPYDSGARWCSLLMLARTRPYDPIAVDPALHTALKREQSTEMLRSIGATLADLDPLTV
jgi:transcriptional regulator with XRE-family HTH domain